MKTGTLPTLRSTRLLDQLRERVRYRHYSLRTERAYVHWVRRFVHFHGLRYPREMGGAEVAAFLFHLADQCGASASTHKQALSALPFLYRQVLELELPWMQEIGRPRAPVRVPVVLGSDRTRCGIRSRRICSSAARTSARSRSCSATAIWTPR